MAEPETVTHLPRPMPQTIELDRGVNFTPNEMRQLKQLSGLTITQLLGEASEDNLEEMPDRLQALAWVGLRRQGLDPSWEQAGDVFVTWREETPQPRDPTSTES
jgi:hypothetical protein